MERAVRIEIAREPTADLRALIAALDATLARIYPPEQRHGLTLDGLFEPHVRFFIARLDGAAAGCGGVALFDGFAEVKRMFVREDVRGSGIARALLARIEDETLASGRDRLRLETGALQDDAIRLYERAGFTRCAAFGGYVAMTPAQLARSIFFEKRLTASV